MNLGLWGNIRTNALQIFAVLLATACLLQTLALPYAAASPGNDDAYESVYTINNGTMYIFVPSLVADEYNPPFYQLSAQTVFVSAEGRETERYVTFRYNHTKQTIYLKGTDDKWYWLDPSESEISAKEIDLAARMFFLCYKVSFDGSQD